MALDQQHSEEKEMSFLDHLEELRWHIVRSVAAIMVFMILAFVFAPWIFDNIVFAPANANFPTFRALCRLAEYVDNPALCVTDIPFKIQSRYVTGQFSMQFAAAFVIGLIIAFPYVFWEIWRFIKPGLYNTEKKSSRGAVIAVTFLFLLGISFGYYVLCPMSMWFFATYSISTVIVNEFDITSYVQTIIALVFGSGVLFQLPVVIFFLTRIGIVTPKFLRTYRKHAIIIILILAAIITPPDPLSQTIIAVPLYLLYEISILISGMEVRRKLKVEALEAREGSSNS
ncbi:MAG TPA: twin-arginine translocase subunit TatC [Cyclobacteriaceae bacterium]|nr:twin-arginine translocase subunit TatC [Cyclobacteriaceae bacterium]